MDLKKGAHLHFMGICGTAMASLAGIMKDLAYHVSGSDQNVYPPMSTQLAHLGIQIMEGYKKEHLSPKPDLVIVGNVITRKNEEAQALLETDIPYMSLPQALGEFVINRRNSVVIAGTHGKTTTTSLMAWTAHVCGAHPGFLIGGIPLNFSQSFQVPKQDLFIIEGDEYDTAFFDKVPKFTHYRPTYGVLTSVEFDHADIYKDLDDVKRAFRLLFDKIPSQGWLIANCEDKNVAELIETETRFRIIRYGTQSGDYHVRDIHLSPEFCEFDIIRNGVVDEHLRLTLFGDYNIANAVAVYAQAREMGLNKEKIRDAFETFKGVKRRQEIIGRPRNITVIEDFAHHPTAVRVTLKGIRERFQNGHVFAVFEPRSATSRRNIFQKDYVEAFHYADTIMVADVFNSAGLDQRERLHPSVIIDELKSQGVDAHFVPSNDEIIEMLCTRAKSGDVIVLMSNGAFGGIYQKLLDRLSS